MKYPKLGFIALFTLLCLSETKAQDLENSLLWRISGKQLKSPSYLYGTLHIKDKKVFNFPDSLYSAIDQCAAFALEFNPDSINSGLSDYLSNQIEKNRKKKKEKKLKDILSKEDLDEIQGRLNKSSKVDAGELTTKQAYLMKEKLLAPKKKDDDMQTFMDAFLYKIAKDKDKTIAGLEPLSLEMDLLDNISDDDADAKVLVKNIKKKDNTIDFLIQTYLDKDINKIQKWSELMPSSFENKVLIARNKKMVLVMDSIMQHQSLFSATGAAHLPGNIGLISLLKQMGYTVEPVLCNSYTHASKYVFQQKEKPWVNVIDSSGGYLVKMPSTPSDVKVMGGVLNMKTFVDLTTSQGYYTMHLVSPMLAVARTKDSLFEIVSKSMITSTNGINAQDKEVSNHGTTGREYTFEGKSKVHYRMQLLVKENDLYMLMSNSSTSRNSGIDSFYQSFRILPKFKSSWTRKTFDNDYLSVYSPGIKPKATIDYDADSTYIQESYIGVDETVGSYYFLYVSKALSGYNFTDDSAHIEGIEERMTPKTIHFERKVITTPNYSADEYEGVQAKGVMFKGRQIYSGNRMYNAMVVYPDNSAASTDATSYLESINILPIPSPINNLQIAPDTSFKTYSCAPFRLIIPKVDTTVFFRKNNDSLVHYNSYDEKRIINYDVFKQKLGSYFWNTSDTATLSSWLNRKKSENETISNIKFDTTGGIISAEATFTRARLAQVERVKVLRQGRTKYTLTAYIPPFATNDKSIDSTFSNFKILTTDNSVISNNPTAFYEALHSSDSTTYDDVVKQGDNVFFSKEDVKGLLKEFTKTFALDTSNYYRASTLLLNQIEANADKLSVNDIAELYLNTPKGRRSQKFSVLDLFTKLKDSVAAYAKLKSLLLSTPPTSGNGYSLLNDLKEHPNLSKQFYPEWLSLTKDSSVCSLVCKLAKELIDSGHLSLDSIKEKLPLLLANSKTVRRAITPDNDYTGMAELLSLFDSPEVWNEIKLYQNVQDNYIRESAVKLLLNKKIQPDASAIDSLASDKAYRKEIYDLLTDNSRTELFPKRYLNQRSFAESWLYNSYDEDRYEYMKFIGEKQVKYNGKTQKFYLFEIKYSKQDEDSYLGIAGPYSKSQLNIVKDEDDATGVYSKEPLNGKSPDDFVKAYFKDLTDSKREYKD